MANPSVGGNWPVEKIPNDDRVFMRVHRQYWGKGELGSSYFKDLPEPGTGMSVNWSKYSDAIKTRLGQGHEKAHLYGVIVMSVAKIREIAEPYSQEVMHDPKPDNRSHSLVLGDKPPKVRVLLRRECDCKVVIHCEDPVKLPKEV